MKIPRLLALALFGSVLPADAATVYQDGGLPDMDNPGEAGGIPEASTAALLGLLGTTLLVRRRRI